MGGRYLGELGEQAQGLGLVTACVCAVRGYCADVAGDPLACPVCVKLAADEVCPAELLLARDRGEDEQRKRSK